MRRSDPWSSEVTVSVRLFQSILDTAELVGLFGAARRTKIEVALGLADSGPTGRLPERALYRLWETIIAVSGEDHGIGARFSLASNDLSLGIVGDALLHTPSLMEAYLHLARYARLIHQGVAFEVEQGTTQIVLRYRLAGQGALPRTGGVCAGILWTMGNLSRLPEYAFATQLRARTVRLSCARPADDGVVTALFGPSVSFDCQASSIVLDRDLVHRLTRPPETRLLHYLDMLAERDLIDLPDPDDLVATLSRMLHLHLAGGPPPMAAFAANLGLSTRSLQRHLAQRGTSWEKLLDRVRKREAERLLADGRCAMGEIAYRLGYGEQATFTRAAKRWFGKAPTALARQRAARGQGDV